MIEDVIYRQAHPIDAPDARYPGFQPGTTLLAAGTVISEGALPLPCDILFERDVAVTLRDGTVIYTDVFRPIGESKLPAIVAWSPYGKEGGTSRLDNIPDRYGVPKNASSGLEKWEGPDPAYWCAHGYAIVNPDARGAWMSEGDIQFFGTQEGRDGCDLIEWIAAQAWSNGRVGMSGNSWLGIMQWFIAAEQPPHLTAIAPWEGLTDFYREASLRGGIPDLAFCEKLTVEMCGNNRVEDVPAMYGKYPLVNAYWEDKAAKLENIKIPAYVVASWTNGLHTPGTFSGYERIASADKWLRIHLSHEWPDYHEQQDDLRRFFDRYLKGVANGWETTPHVRLSIYDPGGSDELNRAENEFPLVRTDYQALYLDAQTGSLSSMPVGTEAIARYDTDQHEQVTFTMRFESDMELAGHLKLRLWMAAVASDDMDVFALVQKLDAAGVVLVPPSREPGFTGAHGRLRVSHRAIDPVRSTPANPFHPHSSEERLTPGQIVPIEIALTPIGMRWHAGEQLRVIVAGFNPAQLQFEWVVPAPTRNYGVHLIYTGGQYDSHLLVPMIPSQTDAE